MATNPLLPARRPANPYPLPGIAPLSPFAARLAQIPRKRLEALSEAIIAILDIMDDDLEAEPSAWTEDIAGRRRRGDAIEDLGVEDCREGFDPEEDHCEAGDDGCAPVFVHGRLLWGYSDEA